MILSSDEFYLHLESVKRNFMGESRVDSFGYYPHKKHVIKRVFGTFNYSFILSGRGYYRHQGKLQVIIAPAVICQEPGGNAEYGPEEDWEEFYILYPSVIMGTMEKYNLYNRNRPVWKINNFGKVIQEIRTVLDMVNDPHLVNKADQIDYALQGIIMQSLIENPIPQKTSQEILAKELYDKIRIHYNEDYNIDKIAESKGLSPSSLRKAWSRIYNLPPGKYIKQQRIYKAVELLSQTTFSIKKISSKVGYSDSLYFSRLFREQMGVSPREYRQRCIRGKK